MPLAVISSILLTLFVAAPSAAQTAGDSLEITFASNSAAERETADQLRRLLRQHRVGQWIFTRRIHIDERERIPHSHPVLTLNTRFLRDDDALLATFVHEQFHWLEDGNAAFGNAMRAYAVAYPDAPSRGPEGGYNLESTYRHLLVCDLEFQAMSILVGAERAREVLASHRYYTWIYQRVLGDPTVRRIATEYGFELKGTP